VREVHAGPANDAIDLGDGLLLPLVAACIRSVDLEAGRILVAPGFSDPD
jgi:ribosomal 30S subunit maturation factor RimM